MSEADLVHLQVGDRVLADIVHGQAEEERDGEAGVDQLLPERRTFGVVIVEVHLVRVEGQHREPRVVRGRDGPPPWVLVDVSDLEVLEVPPVPSLSDRHRRVP